HAKNFVVLDWEADKNFPRHVDRIRRNFVLKISARLEHDARAGMVVHDILDREMPIDLLQMIGQPIVCAVEIEALVLDAESEVPFAGDEKAMVVAEIIVKRIAVPESLVAKIAVQRVR